MEGTIRGRVAVFQAAVLLLVLGLSAGCSVLSPSARVVPYGVSDTAELTADQVAELMRQVGFSDEEILRLGTDLRNALALRGGARIQTGSQTDAIFVVHEDCIYVAAKRGMNTIYQWRNRPPQEPAALPREQPIPTPR